MDLKDKQKKILEILKKEDGLATSKISFLITSNLYQTEEYLNELLKLKPCSYKFIDGTSNRPHTGLIAQDLEGTMFELSGAYIKDRKKKTIIENGISKEVDVEGFNYGLRYSELISPIIRLLQKQQEKITQLEQMNEVIIKLLSETLNK